MRSQSNGILTFLVVSVVVATFGYLIWSNAPDVQPAQVIIPTQIEPTADINPWQAVLRAGFGSDSTPLPTVDISAQQFTAPTLVPPAEATSTPFSAAEASENTNPLVAAVATPTLPAATVIPAVTGEPVAQEATSRCQEIEWQPPALKPPLSRDPLGRDHFWFSRPVDSNANSEALFYYLYGSDGPEQDNPWKIHHGIDLPNCLGEPVRAAGSGTVIWASDGLRVDDGIFENSPSYGNVVQIEHDFGYQGQKIYTVYAHLAAALVERGQRVEAEDVIGLVGDSGRASGPHVHFEVRIGEISQYRATYNPVLWMAPFVDQGVIAGRIVDARGSLIQDLPVTIRNWATGLVETTTTSYVLLDRADDINPDPAWRENFAAGDIPVGRYQIIANINGERVSELVDVLEGATTFVELKPSESATSQPATPES